MHFVIIDIDQLHTRLVNSTGNHDVALDDWLKAHGFQSADAGYITSTDGMSSLSCSEIILSEALDVPHTANFR